MSSWSCPHDLEGVCQRVSGARCDPGMRGCVLHGRVVFANADPGVVRKPQKAPPKAEAIKPGRPKRRVPF